MAAAALLMGATVLRSAVLGLAALAITTGAARADYDRRPWSVTVYYGPASTRYFCAFFQDFNMHPTTTMLGVALDRKLINFGYDISLAAEVQVTGYFFGHTDATGAAGIGLEFDKLLGYERTSLSFFFGPSYATDPPYTSVGYKMRVWPSSRETFLNATSAEFASGLPGTENWDWVFRMYHRSGVFGLYSIGDDDGLAFGLGVKYHF